jgi:hypothetical protein
MTARTARMASLTSSIRDSATAEDHLNSGKWSGHVGGSPDPLAYLTEALDRIPGLPPGRLHDLLPGGGPWEDAGR